MRASVVLGLVYFHTKSRDWLGEMSPKLPILCRVGRKNHNAINQPIDRLRRQSPSATDAAGNCCLLVGGDRPSHIGNPFTRTYTPPPAEQHDDDCRLLFPQTL